MKKFVFISLCLFWSILSFSQIRITNPTYEFGDVFEENGLVYAEFELENPYFKDTIVIKSILTTCGCTVVETMDTLIFPRSKLQLKISYNPDGRVGRFHKSVQVNTITGKNEKNKLFLKLGGIVVPKNKVLEKNAKLIDYAVAPMYFYPITVYDTSFLDFNFITDFVNAITYEIDYYQFSKIGFEIELKEKLKSNQFEYLLRFIKYKVIRELNSRGYSRSSVFFSTPSIIISSTIPKWASARIKVFSVGFNEDNINESKIKMTNPLKTKSESYLIKKKQIKPFILDSLINLIDFKYLTNQLLKDSILELSIDYKSPTSYNYNKQLKLINKFKKEIFKELEANVGISKNELIINVNKDFHHVSSLHSFLMWIGAKNNPIAIGSNSKISYQPKNEHIISPLLPTFKKYYTDSYSDIDEESIEFKQFWNTLIVYSKSSSNVKLLIESSTSYFPTQINSDAVYTARQRSKKVKEFIEKKYFKEVGDSIQIEILNVVLGPNLKTKLKYSKFIKADFFQYEYINLVPVFTKDRKLNLKPISTRPYMVNYDYYFKAIDTNSFVFKKFVKYIIYEIQKNGFVSIITESSSSKIPFEKNTTNQYIAYRHLNESKKVLIDYLQKHLIDPNRLIIDKENIIVQGIPYHKKTPIVRYKKFQYVRFIPTNYLKH